MNRCVLILGSVFALCLAGCASFSTDSRLVGVYSASNFETLVFLPDGRVFHSQVADGKEERFFLGYYAGSRSNPGSLVFAGPDTSPFLGTSFQANEDFSTVTASWGDFRKPKDSWQGTYHKAAKTN